MSCSADQTVRVILTEKFQTKLNIFSSSLPAAAVSFQLVGGISDIYLLPFFIWVHVHAHWNNCSPAECRHAQLHDSCYFLSGFFFPHRTQRLLSLHC